MAASELNNRLDYLISYSSQLVFVCSDKIQQQSQVVESFIAHQNEQADLALLTANELTPLVTYREKLFRQLVSPNQEADFNRPLNQLLAPLNNHNGSILISIFQAEKLPNKLVKELWDLVLQSRFANNKQQLNVLLMGLSDWAESAKSNLGAKSKEQPIMLNSQIDTQHIENNEFSDLESFIQDKRKKFAQRVEERHNQPYLAQPIYKKWWVAALFALFFLVVFTGILSWQYPDKIRAMVTYINAQLPTKEQPLDEASSVIKLAEPAPTETIQPIPQAIEDLTTPINTAITSKVSTTDLLVTDWGTASANIEEQSNKVLLQVGDINQPIALKTKQPPAPETEPEKTILVKEVRVETNTVNDYQVEDKVNLEPIAEPIPILEPKELQLTSVSRVQSDSFINPEPDVLLALPTENFVIQIAAMANISILQDYVKDEQLGQQLWLYKTQRYGGDWYVLLKNQHFPSIEVARAEIVNLEDAMLRNTPFVKSIRQIKQEILASRP